MNFDLYPDETFQKQWLHTYLLERARLKEGTPTLKKYPLAAQAPWGYARDTAQLELRHSSISNLPGGCGQTDRGASITCSSIFL